MEAQLITNKRILTNLKMGLKDIRSSGQYGMIQKKQISGIFPLQSGYYNAILISAKYFYYFWGNVL